MIKIVNIGLWFKVVNLKISNWPNQTDYKIKINIPGFWNINMSISGEDGAGVSGAPSDTVRFCVVFAVSDVCDKGHKLSAGIWLPWMLTTAEYLMAFDPGGGSTSSEVHIHSLEGPLS